MAALDFPSSPTDGQVFNNWVYSTSKGAWKAKPLTPGQAQPSATAPTNPSNGDQWYNTNDGNLYIYYNDGDTSQWVQVKSDATLSSTLGNRVTTLELPGRVIQTVSTFKNIPFSTTNTAWTDVTGLSVSITPQYATSKIFVIATYNVGIGATSPNIGYVRLVRDSTAIAVGDQAGADQKTVASTWIENDSGMTTTRIMLSQSMAYLDSPASTSALTYKVQVARNSLAASTIYINRSSDDSNLSYRGRTASTITVMEIAA